MTDIQLPPLPPKALLRTLHSDRLPTSPFTVYAHTDETLEAYARAAIEAHEARKVLVPERSLALNAALEYIGRHTPHLVYSEIAAALASAPPAPQHDNETINKLRAGYPAAIDAAIREQASVVKQEPVAWAVYVAKVQNFYVVDSEDDAQLVDDCTNNDAEVWPLYAHPAPVREPLTPEQEAIINFLLGASDLESVWFGDRHPQEKGAFWWRERLRRAFQQAAHGITKDTP